MAARVSRGWRPRVHVPTLLFGDMSLRAMHSLHVFPERAGVCVTLGTARDFAYIRFLSNARKNELSMVIKVIIT